MDAYTKFLSQFPVKRIAKEEIVLYQGEVPRSVYVIKRGIIKTYNISSGGDEKPITFNTEKDMFPSSWVFGKAPGALYFYEAFTDCEVYYVDREEFLRFVEKDNEVLRYVLDKYVTNYASTTLRINALEYSKAIDKITHTLFYLCLKFGKVLAPNVTEIKIPFTQQELANFVGLTRETTGLELKKLQKRGAIEYRRRRYLVVHTDELAKLQGEDEFKDLKISV